MKCFEIFMMYFSKKSNIIVQIEIYSMIDNSEFFLFSIKKEIVQKEIKTVKMFSQIHVQCT